MNKEQAVNYLKSFCDGIEPSWQEHLEFWEGEKERGYYNDMAVLAHYVVDRYAEGKTDDFLRIFDACEYIYDNADEDAQDVLYLGFIEGLLFITSHKSFGTRALEKWMGPNTLKGYIGLREAFDALARKQRAQMTGSQKMPGKMIGWLKRVKITNSKKN